jgi:polysaccharide chain length determinant protein (PEP-CTERM system associated)
MAKRRYWFIVMPFVVCLLATLVVSSRLQNQYRAETLLQIVPQQIPDAYVRSTVTIRTESRLNALNQQVMSRTELERLILSLDLYRDARARMPMQDVVELMRANTNIEPLITDNNGRKEAESFYIRFTYPDATMAAKVAERLGSLFIDQNARDRGALAETTDEFLQTQLAGARKQLEVQEQKLERFREEHAGRLPSQLQFNMQAIQNVQLQVQAVTESLARDRDRKLMLERLYNDAQDSLPTNSQAPSQADTTAPATGTAAVAGSTAEEQLLAARGLLAKLELTRKPEHPDVIRTKRMIADLEGKVAELAKLDPGTAPPVALNPEQVARRERIQQMRAEIESLDRQIGFKDAEERRLRTVIAEHQSRIEAVPGMESEWTALTRDYETQQAAYRDLLAKSEQAKLAANLERRQVGEQFRILDPPRIPETPVSPKRIQISAIGFAAGLLLGVALAGFMEFRDQTFHKEGEILEVLGLPVVALVPAIESAIERRQRSRRQLLLSMSLCLTLILGGVVFWSMKLWRYVA